MSALSATRVGAVGGHWRPALKCQGQGRPVLISKATVTGRLLSASMFAGTPTFLIRRGAATMGSLMSAALRATKRSEEHTSELQSLMRISYAVFCLKKKKQLSTNHNCILAHQ